MRVVRGHQRRESQNFLLDSDGSDGEFQVSVKEQRNINSLVKRPISLNLKTLGQPACFARF